LVLTMFVASKGSALVAAWTGEFISRNPTRAKILFDTIGDDYVRLALQKNLAQVEDPARVEKLAPSYALKDIYGLLRGDLNQPAIAVLHVLCSMPGPLGLADLSTIIGKPISAKVIESLDELSFVQGSDGLYTSHPFVRELWEASGNKRTLTPGLIAWAKSVLEKYSPGRDPNVSQAVVQQWANVSAVLRDLAASRSVKHRVEHRRSFLRLWRMADGFLWAVGRWRERQNLGKKARDIAASLKDHDTEVLAIYDALAMTHWYRDRTVDEAERLIDEAAGLAKKHNLQVARARIEWYRSRMLLHAGRVKDAKRAANDAVKLAEVSKDAETRMVALIGLGDAHLEDEAPDSAIRCYEEAECLLDRVPPEIDAILDRSYGRVFLRNGDYAKAIRHFEDAVDRFIGLGLVVQAATTAVYNAEALARAGEPETAQRHLDWGRLHLDPLGSVLRKTSIDVAAQAIKNATP
jgi:hypothetical protein